MKRPPVDRSLSTQAQSTVADLLDLIEAACVLYEAAHELDAVGKPTGKSHAARDSVGISRPVEGEVLELERVWGHQRKLGKEAKELRAKVVGLARASEEMLRNF